MLNQNALYDDARSVADEVNDFNELRETIAMIRANLNAFEPRSEFGKTAKQQLLNMAEDMAGDAVPEGALKEERALIDEAEYMGLTLFDSRVPNWVNIKKHVVAQNNKRKDGFSPALRLQRGKSGKPTYGFHFKVTGPSEIIYSPAGPILRCGARAAIKTNAVVEVVK